jgi:hypothetical protein
VVGGAPTSFLIPSFPPETRFIRAESTLTSPAEPNSPEQKQIKSKIEHDQRQGRQLLLMEVTYESVNDRESLKRLNLKADYCELINDNTSKYLYTGFVYYSLCSLSNIK